MDKISVIVPVFRVEAYLERCVRSICRQTHPELEIILVDDGSPDKCGEICERLATEDRRIRIIHKDNGGLSSARNAGIDASMGAYLAFVDSDDWIDPTMLATLLRLSKQYNAQISECSYRSIYQNHMKEETSCDARIIEATPVQAIEYNLDWRYLKPVAWNKLYAKEITDGIRYPIGKIHEDEFTTHQFYLAARKIVYADVSFYNYDCTREDSITAKYQLRNLDACLAFHQKAHMIWETPGLRELDQKISNAYCYVLLESFRKCIQASLDGPELQNTINMAIADREELKKHGLFKLYRECLEALSQTGLLACVELWKNGRGC